MSASPMLKSSTDWLKEEAFAAVVILDPDGWDRQNLDESFAEPISRQEFVRRLSRSSQRITRRTAR